MACTCSHICITHTYVYIYTCKKTEDNYKLFKIKVLIEEFSNLSNLNYLHLTK